MTSNAKRRRNKKNNPQQILTDNAAKTNTETKSETAADTKTETKSETNAETTAETNTETKPRRPKRRKENIQMDVEESDEDEEPPKPRKRSNSFSLLPDLLLSFNKIMMLSQANPSNLMPTIDAEVKRIHKIIARSALDGSLFPSNPLDANNPFVSFMKIIASGSPLSEQSALILKMLSGQNPLIMLMTSMLTKNPLFSPP